jgi:hypothetical protein
MYGPPYAFGLNPNGGPPYDQHHQQHQQQQHMMYNPSQYASTTAAAAAAAAGPHQAPYGAQGSAMGGNAGAMAMMQNIGLAHMAGGHGMFGLLCIQNSLPNSINQSINLYLLRRINAKKPDI